MTPTWPTAMLTSWLKCSFPGLATLKLLFSPQFHHCFYTGCYGSLLSPVYLRGVRVSFCLPGGDMYYLEIILKRRIPISSIYHAVLSIAQEKDICWPRKKKLQLSFLEHGLVGTITRMAGPEEVLETKAWALMWGAWVTVVGCTPLPEDWFLPQVSSF